MITQNIDGLHAAGGHADPIEVHGSIAHCLVPRAAAPRPSSPSTRARLDADQDGMPHCVCGSRALKPDVVLFGEFLPEAAMDRARGAAPSAPTCCSAWARRSRSTRSPACPSVTLRAGGAVAIVTQGGDQYDDRAAVRAWAATWSPSWTRSSRRLDG